MNDNFINIKNEISYYNSLNKLNKNYIYNKRTFKDHKINKTISCIDRS